MRDLDSVRTFLSGPGPVALFDLPWMPVYLSICFAFHFLVGITALIGGFILIMLTLLREWLAHNPTRLGTAHTQLLESSRRNTEALVAMGMVGNIIRRWRGQCRLHRHQQARASDVDGGLARSRKCSGSIRRPPLASSSPARS
jgi:ATP-binding cassette subfamily C protein PrsD